jgi:hypothetical protein
MDMSGSENSGSKDSGSEDSGSRDSDSEESGSEGHSVLFEIAEEFLDGPSQVADFGYDSDFMDNSDEDAAEIEGSALPEDIQIGYENPLLPEVVIQLQEKLLGDYTLPPYPDNAPVSHPLSRAEELSLRHYLAWTESQGTVKAYSAHAKVLTEATNVDILSLYSARKLAEKLTGLRPSFIDMCPKSCLAYTGEFQYETHCTHSHNGKICNEPRYKQKQGPKAAQKPRAQMLYIPITCYVYHGRCLT